MDQTPAAPSPKPCRSRSGSETRKTLPPFPLRLLPEERAAIEAAAEQARLTIGSYIRQCVLDAPTTRARRLPSVEVMAIIKLRGELNKIGTNIYQLLRHVNFGRLIDPDGEIAAAFADYRETTAVVRAALRRYEQPPPEVPQADREPEATP
jgi:hypothetical protein